VKIIFANLASRHIINEENLMEQHPVPQNITSYEFRLVGDMTLKQFFELAGGVVAGIFFYRLPVIALVKIPLAILAVVTGVLMAFVPLQGRPFTQWIVAFIRAIYSPTQFIWVPTTGTSPSTGQSVSPAPVSSSQVVTTSPSTETATTASSTQNPISLGFLPALKALLSRLLSGRKVKLLDEAPPSPIIAIEIPKEAVEKPVSPAPQSTPTIAPPASTSATKPIDEAYILSTPNLTVPKIVSSPPKTIVNPTSTQTSTSRLVPQEEISPAPKIPAPPPPAPMPSPSPSFLGGTQTVFEATPAPTTVPLEGTKVSAESVPFSTPTPPNPASAQNATVSTAISAPTSPNILAGLITDSEDKTLNGATIEIVDASTGIPVRALRSNRLGQFQIAIPLPPGSYIVNVEKDNLVFNPVSVTVANSIIQPIMIKARPTT
jgi:hypothetical protein